MCEKDILVIVSTMDFAQAGMLFMFNLISLSNLDILHIFYLNEVVT